MPERCLVCLAPLPASRVGDYHARCLRRLTGAARVPRIEIDAENLDLSGLKMAGRVSLSGVQRKVSLGPDRKTLRVAAEHSFFLLKPQTPEFAALPENEHLSLRLAALLGLRVAEAGLVRLGDGRLALLVRRFDRLEDGTRLPMEDFCQLNELPPGEKYEGSAELCARTVRQWSEQPVVDLARLFRSFLFSWWAGNGDLHLKNLALLEEQPGCPRLAPAYDLVNTELLLPGDTLALPVCGRRSGLGAREWLEFGRYCGLPEALVREDCRSLAEHFHAARDLVRASFLPADQQDRYIGVLEEHLASIAG